MSEEEPIGKLLPNMSVTIDDKDSSAMFANLLEVEKQNEQVSGDLESRPAVQDNIFTEFTESIDLQRSYKNRRDGFITALDLESKETDNKLEQRAKRFNLDYNHKGVTLLKINNLYKSFGIETDTPDRKDITYRLNAIHIRGVSDMNTKEVFDYFKAYSPDQVEWINDHSCNVIWVDQQSAARAMLGLSFPYSKNKEGKTVLSDGEITDLEETTEEAMDIDEQSKSDLKIPLPPGIWRKGVTCEKAKQLYLRFATKGDKKIPKAEQHSQYYRKHGNPNFGGLKGLITDSKKRKIKAEQTRIVVQDLSGDAKEHHPVLGEKL